MAAVVASPVLGAGGGLGPGALTRAMNDALHAKAAAVTANTTAGPWMASRRAPSAGPTNEPTLSIVLEETFAAVSSSGDRAIDGSSAASAGRNTVPATVATTGRHTR